MQNIKISRMKEGMCPSKILTCKPRVNIPFGRPRSRWEENITMAYKEIVMNTRNWVDLAQDRDYLKGLVNAALNL